MAKKEISFIESHLKEGNVNCYNMFLLMKAELLSVTGTTSPNEVRKAYVNTASASSRFSFIHNAALAKELAAAFFNRRGDKTWSISCLCDAHGLWGRYGAFLPRFSADL
jgi:hypothetical protein